MRRTTIRSLVLAGALVAFGLPVFSATHSASACSTAPGVVITPPATCPPTTTTIPTDFETFISALSVTPGTAEFAQMPTTAELTGVTITVPGLVSFVVNDYRGNNQGWNANLTCGPSPTPCLSSSLAPGINLAATEFTVGSPITVTTMPIIGQAFDNGLPDTSAYGASLDTNPRVAFALGCQGIGKASYVVDVPLNMLLRNGNLEVLNFPISWTGNFIVTVSELPSPTSPVTTPCPVVLT